VHFPRLILPIATAVVALVGFLICFWILLVLLDWYRVVPNWRTVLLPAFALLALLASVGAALSIAALNVNYRDFRYVIPFIVHFGLYVSPVGFTSSLAPNRRRLSYSLDQMVGEIDGFRRYILHGQGEL
jgi:lipopolysaccharide transport system permease protein